jgi:hypothetical protein
MKFTLAVDFINVLRARFCMKALFWRQNFRTKAVFRVWNFWRQSFVQKCVRITLMKLTPEIKEKEDWGRNESVKTIFIELKKSLALKWVIKWKLLWNGKSRMCRNCFENCFFQSSEKCANGILVFRGRIKFELIEFVIG